MVKRETAGVSGAAVSVVDVKCVVVTLSGGMVVFSVLATANGVSETAVV